MLLIILLFPGSWLGAQITVTNAVFPAAGETLHYLFGNQADAINQLFTPPGGAQTWNLSNLQSTQTWNQVMQNPASGSAQASFAGATMFFNPVNSAAESYLQVTGTQVLDMGYYGPDPVGLGLNLPFINLPGLEQSWAPANFFDLHSSNSIVITEFSAAIAPQSLLNAIPGTVDSFRIRISYDRISAIDGWGNLSIPGGSYDVLRKKQTDYRTVAMDVKVLPLGWVDILTIGGLPLVLNLGTDTIYSFHYLNNVTKEVIAVATLNTAQDAVTQVIYKYNAPACTAPAISTPAVTQPGCATPTGTIAVNATGASTLEYSVDNGANWQTNASFTGLAPGSYNIKVRIQSSPTCSTAYANNPVVLTAATGCCITNPVVVNNNDAGPGSLRQAIIDACPGSTITFDMNQVVSPINLSGGQLVIDKNLTIQGPGASLLNIHNINLPADFVNWRIFEIRNIVASISGVTISGGVTRNAGLNGAGIDNLGQLSLTNCVISGNQIAGSYLKNFNGRGAGIYNGGVLNINNCLIDNNSVTNTSPDGDPFSSGAGICNRGTLSLSNSTVSNGSAESAAGIDNAGTMNIINSAIYKNNAGVAGGILQNGGSLSIINSTISGNDAINGGGIEYFSGNCRIINSTITGNTGAFGSGIYNQQFSLTGTVPPGVFTIGNSILAGNTSDYYFPNDSSIPPAGYANLTSLGNNIFGNVDAPLNWTFNGPGDQLGSSGSPVNPQLGALGNNGGPTQTHALLTNSPAINSGNNALALDTSNVPLTTDQRGTGFPRVVGAKVDIGSFEASCPASTVNAPTVTQPNCATPTGTIVVNATGGGSLEYSVDNGASWQASASFSGLPAGSYNIKVRIQSSPTCSTAYSGNPVVLTAATGCCVPPTINAPTVTQPTCATPTGTIVVNASGGSTLEYSVDNGTSWQASATFSGLPAGSYNIKVRIQSSPTCSTAYSGNPVVLTAATGCCVPPTINAPTVTQPTCATPTGTIVVNASGGSTLEYSVDNGTSWQASASFSGLAAGSYNIKVRIQSSPTCSTAYSGNPVVLTAATGCCVPPTINAPTVTQPTCATPTGTIVVNASGSSALEYSINNGTSWQTSASFGGLAAGSYNIKVRIQSSPTCSTAYASNPVVLTAATGCNTCSITCPANRTVNSMSDRCGQYVSYPAATTTGACGNGPLTYSIPSGSWFPVGTTTVTVTSANQTTCSFTVTVVDVQKPVINCPEDITVNAADNLCGRVVNFTVSATDNCPGVTVVAVPASGTVFNVGTTSVLITARDAAGNVRTCTFKVTVRDMKAPVLNCPPTMVVDADLGVCSSEVNPAVPTATDNCPGVTVTGSRNDGKGINDAYPVGQTIITWKAKDASGNTSTCEQKVIVKDRQPPVISNVSVNPSVLWPANNAMVLVQVNYSLTDNCGLQDCGNDGCRLSVTSNEPVTGAGYGNLSPDWQIIDNYHVKLRAERASGGSGRIYTIRITGRDASGNTSSRTITVTVPLNSPGTRNAAGLGQMIVVNEQEVNESQLSLTAFPNPSERYFNVQVTGLQRETVEIRLLDMQGKQIEMQRGAADHVYRFGDQLAAGMYIIEARSGGKVSRVKVVKQL